MSRPADRRTLFADAVEITHWLEGDRETPYADRLQRDRAISAALPPSSNVARVREWWRRLRAQAQLEIETLASAAERLQHGRRLIVLLMLVVGAFAGAAVASAVFRYDGTWPVNVITVLATLVLLQLWLLALTLLLMLPRAPGVSAVQELLGGLSPGAIAAAVYRRISRSDQKMNALLQWRAAHGPSAKRFARWQMLVWSQIAAVAFNVAALTTAAGLITFTDLAFGWSTTLQMSGADVLRITDALSAPWRSVWPEAVPDSHLIEQSRFFRLASAPASGAPAAAFTGWWPFLLASIFTYGLAPRCIVLVVSLWRLRVATTHLLMDDPGVTALLDRMDSVTVTLGAAEDEAPVESAGVRDALPAPKDARPAKAIIWSGAVAPESVRNWAATHLQWRITQVYDAGGGRALSVDRELSEQVAQDNPPAVLVFVRAWEAPLLDLQDFLSTLRAKVGAQCSLVVVPIGPRGALATQEQRSVWSRWTGRMADPALYLETGV